jgi:hypothetical protein
MNHGARAEGVAADRGQPLRLGEHWGASTERYRMNGQPQLVDEPDSQQ